MKISLHQKLLFFSFIILAGIVLMGYAAYKSNQELLDSEQWVEHTKQVIYQAGYIISLSKDIETASRGFVITKDSTFLEPLYIVENTIFGYIRQLRQLTLDNPKQQQRIDSLDFFMHKRIAFSIQTVELRNKQGLASAIAYISTKQGQKYSEHLRQITDDIQQEEDALLKQRKQVNKVSAETFNRFAEIMFLLMLVFNILLVLSAVKHLRQNKEKEKRADELIIANKELAFQNEEKEKRADELVIANKELDFQNGEKEERAAELVIANKELAFQNEEKEKRAAELVIANKELAFQHKEKEKRATELVIANKELAFQSEEKGKRAAELTIANVELVFQNQEKEKRADELVIANKELVFQNDEKEERAAELVIANKELAFQNEEKKKRAAELVIANKELAFQHKEKEKRATELVIANKELAFQSEEKGKRAAELTIANVELVFQNQEKEKRADELVIANKELVFQNDEKEERAAELVIANKELAFQSEEKGKRAAELTVANVELVFQNQEKEKRAAELVIVNDEVAFQNKEKEKREKEAALEKITNQKEITEAVIAAQENERSEIGRELHDNVNQLLATSKLYNNMGKTGNKDHDAHLDTSANFTMQAIEEIRKLTKKLITPLIKEIGLSKSINEVAEDIMLVNPLKIKLLIKDFDEGILNEKFKLNLFRIIQEQIINTLKHSKAEILRIELSQTNDKVFIGMSDDGVGFDTSQRRKGVGILNIRSRAEQYKGDVVINSAPGKGCSLSVSFKKTNLLLN